ncbi:MAG TPA: isocitrate dehydrogenase, partial [Cyanobacteria bacterium UBA11691]|nr:isocitrate dehydrogenase [Cyanobacteria bacterium UBA11691]
MPTQQPTPAIVVMHGDQTGEELLAEALRVLQPGVIGQPLEFIDYDLSLDNRRASNN